MISAVTSGVRAPKIPAPTPSSSWTSSVAAGEGALEILDEVAGVLDADREAEQAGRRGRARAFDRGAVLDEALDAAELGRALPHLDLRRRGDRRRGAALDDDAQHAAEAAGHLAPRDGVARAR